MQNDCRDDFEERLAALAEVFDIKLSNGRLDIYWSALQELTFEEFIETASDLAKSCKFFPKPVEFLERVGTSIETEAQLAYAKVEKAFTKAGADKSVIFDDSVIHAVIDNLGGWVKYCQLPKDEVKWWRKAFEDAYVSFKPLVAQGRIIPLKKLVGLYEGQGNIEAKCLEPVFIGEGSMPVQNVLDNPKGNIEIIDHGEPVNYGLGMNKIKGILKSL